MSNDTSSMVETREMSLAVYLALEHEPVKVEWRNGSCRWVFEPSDSVFDMIEDFHSGQARVDPKEYNEIYGLMKREMFALKEAS